MTLIDAARLATDIATLATLVEPHTRGTTRRAFTDTYRDSRAWVRALMEDAGLDVQIGRAHV